MRPPFSRCPVLSIAPCFVEAADRVNHDRDPDADGCGGVKLAGWPGPARMRLRRRAVLSYAPRSVLAPDFPQAQLNGKQEAVIRPACAVPATVRRPRDALSARAPMPPTMPLPACFGWEGRGLASGQPGYRPTQGASDTLAERPVRGGRTACAFCVLIVRSCPLRAGCFHSAMHRHSAGRLRATRSPLFPSSPRFAPCRPR